MRIQSRQQLLDIWCATARISFQDGELVQGGRDQSNSISDAEQLLCILYPATELTSFRLSEPDETAEDVLTALRGLGSAGEIPRLLVKVLTRYMERYTNDTGLPTFAGEGYIVSHEPGATPSTRQEELDIVDSFAISITLTLAALKLTRIFRRVITREEPRREVDKLEALASTRLTAAMVGLLRSFSINVFDIHDQAGRILCRRSNRNNFPEHQVIRGLLSALQDTKAGLREVTIGSGQDADLESAGRLFECGWSWGIVKDAQTVKTQEVVAQPDGVAENKPFLYFTVSALAGLEDLFSERIRRLGLLNEEQRGHAQALQTRWDLTQSYWSTIATFSAFGGVRWPLEDLPWRTSDGIESEYYSLLVSAMVVQHLVRTRASDADLGRVGRVLEELANRGRVDRRSLQDDPALEMHAPGVPLRLYGSETLGDRIVGWRVSNFSPLLLKRTLAIAGLVNDTTERSRLLTLADNVWDHLLLRRFNNGPGKDLWDQPSGAYPELSIRHELPSWYYTERVVECLVEAANLVSRAPVRSEHLTVLVKDLLHEADHLYDRELLNVSGETETSMRAVLRGIKANLLRAWAIQNERPGSAMVLVSEVLRELEKLASARENAAGRT
jgi:hypothetical protein